MKHGKKYNESIKAYNPSNFYDVKEALEICYKNAKAGFDETIELHVRLGVDSRHADQQVRGTVVLPNGTGRTQKVLVVTRGAKVDEALAAFGRIDILINNAGTGGVIPAEDMPDETFQHEMDIDLFGTFKFARAVAKKAMIPAKYGRIINIASMYGMVGNKICGSAPYHAAKGGVVNLSRALAAEWGKHGITVNTICPGYFVTPLTKETLDSPWFQEYAHDAIPEERYGLEGELDTAALFLSSPASSYVNGIAVPVDGGYTCI